MSQYARATCPGGTFFFTVVTFDRRPILTSSIARKLLKKALRDVKTNYPFRVDALCLLPDHIHCIMTLPEGDSDYSVRWRAIKGKFSRFYRQNCDIEDIPQSASRSKRRELPIWQRRFWEHMIRDDDDFRRHVEYIHFNPVRHGIVKRVCDWPWSSFHRYVKKGIYLKDWLVEDKDLMGMVDAGE